MIPPRTWPTRCRRSSPGHGAPWAAPSAVEQSAAGYRLAVTPDDVDALRFERLLARGSASMAEALALWRGPALADVGDFAAPHAQRLDGLRLDALVAQIGRAD